MTHFRFLAITLVALSVAGSGRALAQEGLSSYQAIVSVADQKIAVVRDGAVVAKYPISTSRFGVGDSAGSYKTPLGRMKICEKLGDNLPSGAVIKHRRATGEVVTVNAPGRDPIVTRVLWLDGQESGNAHAKDRSIYIHGTPEEKLIGRPASYGCIRMRSQDVIALYQELGVGSTVSVIPDKLPRLAKYEPPKVVPPTPAPKVEVAKIPPPAVVPKPEVAKAAPALVEKVVPPTSPKVLAAIAEAREHEAKFEHQAMLDHAAKPDRDTKTDRETKRVAKAEPLAAPVAKAEKAAPPVAVAKVEKPAAPLPPAVAAGPEAVSAFNAPRLAVAKKRLAAPAPVVVPAPVDQDRLSFLRNRGIASSGSDPSAPTPDLASRLKGSILESGLSR